MHITHDVGDAFLAELLEAFSEAEFIELGIVIAQFISMGQLVSMLRIPNPDIVPLDPVKDEPSPRNFRRNK